MASLATLKARLEALDAAIATGVLTVEHGETRTTFRSMSEMMKARSMLVKQIAEMEGNTRSRLRYAYQSGKGL